MKILIAEDEDVSRLLLRKTLVNWGYDVIVTENGMEALEVLESEDPPKIAILDWIMPEMDGIEVCKRIRTTRKEPYVFIILLTAKGQTDDVIKGMDSGADDYIIKPFHNHELEARLRAGKRIVELLDQLKIQATHDPLTGIWNRGAIFDALEKELNRTTREKRPMGIMLIDIDHFKRINDTYGHPAGDMVLCEVVKKMKTAVRPYDLIGRYGGEEFLIILPGCDKPTVVKTAERLCDLICGEKINISNGSICITISIGVSAAGDDHDNINKEQLLKIADKALYEAKESGRNRVKVCMTLCDE